MLSHWMCRIKVRQHMYPMMEANGQMRKINNKFQDINKKIGTTIPEDISRCQCILLTLMVIVTLIVTFLVTPSAYADIYVYIDQDGVCHFTNAPTSGKYKIYMREAAFKPAPHRTIEQYDRVIAEAADSNGLSPHLLKALIHVESAFDPRAVSKKGALGLTQIMPANLDLLNVHDPFDPKDNVMGGARYLKAMMDRFGGHLSLALAAYNAGPTAVEHYQDIPPFQETRNYVQKVLKYFRYYKNS